jgi:hypothetical protein
MGDSIKNMSRMSMLEDVKIQARAIIPVVKALKAEIWRDRAHDLAGNAIWNRVAS